ARAAAVNDQLTISAGRTRASPSRPTTGRPRRLLRLCPAARIVDARRHFDHEPRVFVRSAECGGLNCRSGGAMITEGPLPHLVQRRAIALEMRGENTDTDDVAQVAAGRPQDGRQVGEEL